MIEWSERNRYNSFSSYKGLAYYEHYKKIVGWLAGKNALPPPIECNLDPCADCNLDCYFCITQRYLKHNRQEAGLMRKLPTEYMLKLIDFLADWGVQGLCLSGGGEPTLHDGLGRVIHRARDKGMRTALFTNGIFLEPLLGIDVMECQWITLSVDAYDEDSYWRIKGKDRFRIVLDTIKTLVELRNYVKSPVLLTWCSLVLPENMYSLHKMCKLAKDLGVQAFRVRPVDFERPDIEGHKPLSIDVPRVMEEFAKCHEEETPDFQVYTTTHKFDVDFHVKHDFQHCYPALILPILSDGNGYLCVDKKMETAFRLGSAYPDSEQILKWWGSDAHRELMKSVDISKCSRCTGGEYNAQIENVVLKDGMCLSFP